ncbi:MAG TPA: monofunctional biosynthetic peptidoglycan transglycosylase [Myxococcota bacterium]|nr:monofunctional biosynthetic peptidoglycan transglycosylase [Myxococcota bacterium]
MAATRRKRNRRVPPSGTTLIANPVLRFLARAVLLLLVGSVAAVIALRWIPPVSTAFMIEARIAAAVARDSGYRTDYRWVPYREISPNLPIAVVAAEDQKFPIHSGFDFDAIADAIEERADGGPARGASTISQQVAKNLFLWPGRSWLRKGIEAYFTVLLETFWPKRRILEVYLNVAEFAPGVFGAGAASQRFFGVPVSRLDREQAAILAAVLPAPDRLHAGRPSDYVRERSQHIASEAERLGGPAYLRALSFQ